LQDSCKLSNAKRSSNSGQRQTVPLKKRPQDEDEEEEDEDEYDDDEEEYMSSEEEHEEERQRGGGVQVAKRGKDKVAERGTSKSLHNAVQGIVPVVKTRRGVVISDDEEG
jgi:hypothetical protein